MLDSLVRVSRRVGWVTDLLHAARLLYTRATTKNPTQIPPHLGGGCPYRGAECPGAFFPTVAGPPGITGGFPRRTVPKKTPSGKASSSARRRGTTLHPGLRRPQQRVAATYCVRRNTPTDAGVGQSTPHGERHLQSLAYTRTPADADELNPLTRTSRAHPFGS